MRHLLRMLIPYCLFGIGITLHAQSTVPASGGVVSGTGGTVSYSIGQIVYTKNDGFNGSVFHGVQQPLEISIITGIKEANDISLDCSVFPNPAIEFIRLKIADSGAQNLSYKLYDISGNVLLSKKIESLETDISMQRFIPGTYFLKISQAFNELKTFKIIKKSSK